MSTVGAPAFVWPHLVFGPLPAGFGVAALSVAMARAAHYPSVTNMGLAFGAAYLALALPCLIFALVQRHFFRSSGRHRLLPVLGAGVAMAVLVALIQWSGAGGREGVFSDGLVLTAGACILATALTGYLAVRLVDALRRTPA